MRMLPAITLMFALAVLAPSESHAEEPSLADMLKSGLLLEHGVTVGLAVAIHTHRAHGHTKLDHPGVSAMPYVLISPRYWWMGDIQAKYCASGWAFFNRGKKKKVADDYARSLARKRLGLKPDETVGDPQVKASTHWSVAEDMYGRCDVAPYINFWAGYPTKFTADASRNGEANGYEFEPRVAFGWGLLLHAYLHVLAGVSYSEFKPGDDQRYASLWSPVVAIGGNIDVFGLLLK